MKAKQLKDMAVRSIVYTYHVLVCMVELVWFILCAPWKIVKFVCCFTCSRVNKHVLKNEWITRGFLCGLGFWLAAFVVRFIERLF